MPEKFDKAERERIHTMIDNGYYPASLRNYVQALEEVAKCAATVCGATMWKSHHITSSVDEAALHGSLNQVDWMIE